MSKSTFMRDRQRPLVKLYRDAPQAAWVTDSAQTTSQIDDPLHGTVELKGDHTIPFSLHTAVGGESDAPVPGDILSGALASCLDSTIRVVADRLGVVLKELAIRVDSEVDVRGTLMVARDVPVGFQRIKTSVHLVPAEGTSEETLDGLIKIAEQCCVVMQTLRNGVEVTVTRDTSDGEAGAAA